MCESFILYTPQYDALKNLTDAQLGKLLRALYLLRKGQQVRLNDAAVEMAFAFITNQFRYDDEKRERFVAQRKAAAQASVSKRQRALTGVSYNVNSNVNSNVNVNKNMSMCEEREIYTKFYFKNMIDPAAEVRRFYEWGNANGWKTKSGNPIASRVHYASFWRPENEGKRFPHSALCLLRAAYDLAREAQGEEIAGRIFAIEKALNEGDRIVYYGTQPAAPATDYIYKAADKYGLQVKVMLQPVKPKQL